MASKESGEGTKSAGLPRACDFTKQFLKDWQRLSRTGRFNMRLLKVAMMTLIANDENLGPEWLDHPLKGNWAHHRECHIGGDFLLIYRIDETQIVFVRAGTHADLFE